MVLPKFELPGDRPHWAVRAAWIAGGLLLLSIIGLGAVIVHHRNLETRAHLEKIEALAKVKAEAEAKVAAVAAAAKAVKEAEIAARVAQANAAAAQKAAAAEAAGGAGAGADGGLKSFKATRSGHRGKSSKSSKWPTKTVTTKTAMQDKSTGGKPKSNKPDAIDELLKKMK